MPRDDRYADAPRLPDGGVLDPAAIVGGDGPLEIEIGSGRGGFLFARLAADERVRIIALEIRRKWASIVDGRLEARGLCARARCFAEDARLALPRLPPASVRAVFVHFPDPWWKKRHHKRLLLAPPMPAELARVLAPAGELFVQTDVPERAESYEALLGGQPGLEPFGDGSVQSGARMASNPYGAESPRERRALADGLPIFRLRFRRR